MISVEHDSTLYTLSQVLSQDRGGGDQLLARLKMTGRLGAQPIFLQRGLDGFGICHNIEACTGKGTLDMMAKCFMEGTRIVLAVNTGWKWIIS